MNYDEAYTVTASDTVTPDVSLATIREAMESCRVDEVQLVASLVRMPMRVDMELEGISYRLAMSPSLLSQLEAECVACIPTRRPRLVYAGIAIERDATLKAEEYRIVVSPQLAMKILKVRHPSLFSCNIDGPLQAGWNGSLPWCGRLRE